jgi:hypothetical protein
MAKGSGEEHRPEESLDAEPMSADDFGGVQLATNKITQPANRKVDESFIRPPKRNSLHTNGHAITFSRRRLPRALSGVRAVDNPTNGFIEGQIKSSVEPRTELKETHNGKAPFLW